MLTPPMPSRRENWHGFERSVFEFQGRTAWIVEPAGPELPGRPWTWCLEWAETYVERTGVAALLGGGFHHVHIDAKGFGNDEDMRVFREFHDRVHFCHFRNIVHLAPGVFRESESHLFGKVEDRKSVV